MDPGPPPSSNITDCIESLFASYSFAFQWAFYAPAAIA
jgi:hypothetical protein